MKEPVKRKVSMFAKVDGVKPEAKRMNAVMDTMKAAAAGAAIAGISGIGKGSCSIPSGDVELDLKIHSEESIARGKEEVKPNKKQASASKRGKRRK